MLPALSAHLVLTAGDDPDYSDMEDSRGATPAPQQLASEEVNVLARSDRADIYLTLVQHWKRQTRLPLLQQVARRLLCVQPTSAEAERTFSIAGHICNRRRLRLVPETVEALTFLRMNDVFIPKQLPGVDKDEDEDEQDTSDKSAADESSEGED